MDSLDLLKRWEKISDDEISVDEYNQYEDFFSYWENKLSMSGVRSLMNPSGFPKLDFCVGAIRLRYRFLKFILSENWIMKKPDSFANPVNGKEYGISDAYAIAYANKYPLI